MLLRKWRDLSLATKFAIGSAAMALSVTAFTGVYAVRVLEDQFNENVSNELDVESTFGSQRIQFYLDRESRNIKNMAQASLVINGIADSFGRDNYLLPFLKDLSRSSGSLVDIGLYDFSGQAIAKSSPELKSDISREALFAKVMGGEPAVLFETSPNRKVSHVSIAYPVVYSATQQVEGALLAYIHLEVLPGMILPHLTENAHMRLLDQHGTVLGSWGWPYEQEMLSLSVPVKLAAPLDKTVLYLEVGRMKSSVAQPLAELIWRITTVNVAVIGVVVFLAMMFGRQISKPLRRLELVAQSVTEQGEFDVHMPNMGNDEVGRLAESFKHMLGFVAVANRVLEMRVRERTQELNEAKGMLRDNLNLTESILNNVVDGIITVDASGKVISCNRAARELLKSSSEELENCNVSDILQINDISPLLSSIVENSDRPASNIQETVLLSADRQPLFIEYAVGDRMEINCRYMVPILIRNISERKEVERLKQEFVASVSHELRTPLTSISGALSLAKRDNVVGQSERLQKLLGMAVENAQNLTELVNDILDLEKIECGQMKFEIKELDIGTLVKQSVETSLAYAHKHGKTIRILFDPRIRYLADVDELRFLQVMNNLLSNAAKYSAGGCQIDVVIAHHCNAVRVSIIDKGNGIPAKMRKNVFSRFWQADSSNTRRVGGTGLGLAITKSLVEGNGGSIGYRSREGIGSIFYFEFPCKKVERAELSTRDKPNLFYALGPGNSLGSVVKKIDEVLETGDVVPITVGTPFSAIFYLESKLFEKHLLLSEMDAASMSHVLNRHWTMFLTNEVPVERRRFPLFWIRNSDDPE